MWKEKSKQKGKTTPCLGKGSPPAAGYTGSPWRGVGGWAGAWWHFCVVLFAA